MTSSKPVDGHVVDTHQLADSQKGSNKLTGFAGKLTDTQVQVSIGTRTDSQNQADRCQIARCQAAR